MAKHTEEFIDIGGCRTRVMRGGSGDPLLFLHGSGGAPQWLPVMEELSGKYDLIVPEHPGYGGTDTPEWLDNIGDEALFYLTFMESLGLEGVHLMGNSLGGWIALEIAVRNTSRLKSMTLASPAGIHLKGVPKGDIFLWSAQELVRNLYVDQKIAEAQLAVPMTDAMMQTMLLNRQTTAKLGWNPRLSNPHLNKWMFRIDIPTLIVWGDGDKVIPVAYAEEFKRLIPGSRTKIFPDCGHLPHVEQAQAFAEEVNAFIAGVAS